MRNREYFDPTRAMGEMLILAILIALSSACLFFGFRIAFDPYGARPILGFPLLVIWIAFLIALAIRLMRLERIRFRVKFDISPKTGEVVIFSESAWTLIPLLWLPLTTHCVWFSNEMAFRRERTFFFHFRARKFARNLAQEFGNGFREPEPKRIDDFSMALHMAVFSSIWAFMAYAVFF